MPNLRNVMSSAAGAMFLLAAATVYATPGTAQEGPGGSINPGRDCQTILTCRFTKGGSYRGCLSSYSCRTCRYEPAKCPVGSTRRRCHTSVCTWG